MSFPRLQCVTDDCTCILDYEYLSVAQACDRRTAVGLARCQNVDPRFFRQFPKLPDSEVRKKTYFIRSLCWKVTLLGVHPLFKVTNFRVVKILSNKRLLKRIVLHDQLVSPSRKVSVPNRGAVKTEPSNFLTFKRRLSPDGMTVKQG